MRIVKFIVTARPPALIRAIGIAFIRARLVAALSFHLLDSPNYLLLHRLLDGFEIMVICSTL
jgi:hypothetical protein